jgi:hypothetical protein
MAQAPAVETLHCFKGGAPMGAFFVSSIRNSTLRVRAVPSPMATDLTVVTPSVFLEVTRRAASGYALFDQFTHGLFFRRIRTNTHVYFAVGLWVRAVMSIMSQDPAVKTLGVVPSPRSTEFRW